jgi:hypothetical protein
MRATLGVGKLGVLMADPRKSHATKGLAHVTGNAKSSGGPHSAMSLSLNSCSFGRRVEHAGE